MYFGFRKTEGWTSGSSLADIWVDVYRWQRFDPQPSFDSRAEGVSPCLEYSEAGADLLHVVSIGMSATEFTLWAKWSPGP